MHSRLWLILALTISLFAAGLAPASDKPGFSTEPPAIYFESIAPLLTPAETAIAAAVDLETRRNAGDDGSTLLIESIYWVADDGAIYRADHTILRANTEAVSKELARESTPFAPSRQKVHLVLARTLTPDGKWQKAPPEAAFVQTPQREADKELFTDRAELVVIFPQIQPGSITESIILCEEPVFRIPGELTATFTFGTTWSTDRLRVVFDLPAALAQRFVATPVGTPPAMQRQDLEGGRSRFEWDDRAPSRSRYKAEPRMAPRSVLGPAIWLSTLESWQAVAEWYRTLLAGRDEISPALRRQAEEWAAGAETQREIVTRLHRHVADDIRYTGLEFGIAGYQPKMPTAVWEEGYGDCKDKANLLRALLKAQGIPSSLALVNTYHTGDIEKRSPDFRAFDHAILAIELADGVLWADPTVPYLDPGELGPGSADREVLIVPTTGWRFARTPQSAGAAMRAGAEVQVGFGGHLEGFLEISANGYLTSGIRGLFQGDENARLRKGRRVAQDFFPGAEVIDVALPEVARGRFEARIYFVVAGVAQAESGEETLRAISGGFLLEPINQAGPRRTAFPLGLRSGEVDLLYRLPAGWAPRALPESFAAEVPALTSRASWTCEPGLCRAHLWQESHQGVADPADFAALHQSQKALFSWLQRPVTLLPGKESGKAPATVALENFPLMPTGAGQLRLLDFKYPIGQRDQERRAALAKIRQWFPDDADTFFAATLQLGLLDCHGGAEAEGAENLRQALRRFETTIAKDNVAAGRFVLASCPGLPPEESAALLRSIIEDPGVQPLRKGWSLLLLGEQVGKSSPAEALVLFEQALPMAKTIADAEFSAFLWSGLARSLAQLDDARLESTLKAALEESAVDEVATQLGASIASLEEEGQSEAATRLYEALEKAGAGNHALAAVLAEAAEILQSSKQSDFHAEIARELAGIFSRSPPEWWDNFKVDPSEDAAAAARKVVELEPGNTAPFVRQTVHFLTDYPPSGEFSHRLFQVAWCFKESFPEAPQTEKILNLLLHLPKTDDYHWEGRIFQADRLISGGDIEGGLAYFDQLLTDPGLPASYAHAIAALRIAAQLQGGRWEAAKQGWAEIEPVAELSLPVVVETLAQMTLLALEQGRFEDAWHSLRRFRDIADSTLDATDYPLHTRRLKALASDEARAREAWQNEKLWWPKWQELGAALGASQDDQPVTTLVEDLDELGEQVQALVSQNQPKAAFAALSALAHASRWDPALALDLSNIASPLGQGSLFGPFLETTIALLRALPPSADNEQMGRQLLFLGARLLDIERPGEALVPLRALAALDLKGLLHQRGVAMLAAASLKEDEGLEEARDLLEKVLDDSFPAGDRSWAVGTLASLYRRLGQTSEEQLLLEREVKHPANQNPDDQAELVARFEASRHGGEGDAFAQAWSDFRRRYPLPVLEIAEPASLDDPRLAGKPLAKLTEGDWTEVEKVKIAFLVAADPLRSVSDRSEALSGGLFDLRLLLPRQSLFREMLQSLRDESRFPDALRSNALFWLTFSWAQHENADQLDALQKDVSEKLAPRGVELYMAQRELQAARRDGPEAIEKLVESLLSRRLTAPEVISFMDAWPSLVLRGKKSAAERLLPKVETLETKEKERADDLRLGVERGLIELSEARRLAETLRQVIPGFASAGPRPSLLDESVQPSQLWSLSQEDCLGVLRYDLHTFSYLGATSSVWPRAYFFCRHKDAEIGRIARDLLLAVLDLDLREETKAEWLRDIVDSLPKDEQSLPGLMASLRERVDAVKNPKLDQSLHLIELTRRGRSGEKINFEAEMKEAKGFARERLLGERTQMLLHEGDLDEARKFLASHSPAELKVPYGLTYRLALAQLLPDTPEARVVTNAGKRQIYLDQIEGLTAGDWNAAARAIKLQRLLNGKAGHSKEWLDAVLAGVDNPIGKSILLLTDAEAREDWPAAYTNAKALIAAEGQDHNDQWLLGRAAFRLGKNDEAKAALRLFLSAAKNHPDSKEAAELLAKLEGP